MIPDVCAVARWHEFSVDLDVTFCSHCFTFNTFYHGQRKRYHGHFIDFSRAPGTMHGYSTVSDAPRSVSTLTIKI